MSEPQGVKQSVVTTDCKTIPWKLQSDKKKIQLPTALKGTLNQGGKKPLWSLSKCGQELVSEIGPKASY